MHPCGMSIPYPTACLNLMASTWNHSWTLLSRNQLSRTPPYLEQDSISLGFARFFQSLTMGLLSRTPCYLELFLTPLSSNHPGYLELYYGLKEHWSTSARKCSQGTSWQDVLKAEKCIDVFTVTEGKSDWLDLPLWTQKATSCRYLLILGIKLLLQKFDTNLAISNPRYLKLFLENLESSRGSTVFHSESV